MEISQTLEEYTDFFNAPPQARKKNVSKAQEKKRQISVWNQFMGLKEQSLLIKESLDICQPKTILQWQRLLNIYHQTSLASVEDTLSYRFQLIPTYPDGKKSATKPAHCARM